MDAIKNYLETMFSSLPDTEETRRAKAEILSMTEDKYNELIGSGMSEHEAIGKIISEFGSLDDLKESLGLTGEECVQAAEEPLKSDSVLFTGVPEAPNPPVEIEPVAERAHKSYGGNLRLVSLDEAKDFLADAAFSRFLLGIGVFFCIIAPAGPIMGEAFGDLFFGVFEDLMEGLGVMFLFLSVALGVGLIILSSSKMKEWKDIKKGVSIMDYETEEYIKSEKQALNPSRSTMLALGIVLCVCCVIPVTFFGIFSIIPFLSEGVGPSMIFVMVGAGVFFILNSSRLTDACDKLLKLNV